MRITYIKKLWFRIGHLIGHLQIVFDSVIGNRNFLAKHEIWQQIKIFGKSPKFGKNWKFTLKLLILAKTRNFRKNSKFWHRLEVGNQIIKFRSPSFYKQKYLAFNKF